MSIKTNASQCHSSSLSISALAAKEYHRELIIVKIKLVYSSDGTIRRDSYSRQQINRRLCKRAGVIIYLTIQVDILLYEY